MDDSFHRYIAALDAKENSLALTENGAKEPKAKLKFQRPAPNELLLDGILDGHNIHAHLQLVDREKFLVVNRGFHWFQEYPFNR